MRSWPIQFAAEVMRAGGIIAYPTEAVWGLGCDPYNESAVTQLLSIKKRSVDKGLILISGDCSDFQIWLDQINQTQRDILQQQWPGFNTWVIPDPGFAPPWIKGDKTGVALRVSAHPLIRALCKAFGGPIVSTSANLTGHPPARNRWQVAHNFHGQLDFVLNGPLGGAKQVSIIKDILSGKSIRGI
ncbi:MAG: Sua5/YciO/YrdC/YwlC family protein [Pseudomonadales bacterium]|nr:Sua5/YciO/YrdC/YwlC family protein [Pseudomonadales bacterium]